MKTQLLTLLLVVLLSNINVFSLDVNIKKINIKKNASSFQADSCKLTVIFRDTTKDTTITYGDSVLVAVSDDSCCVEFLYWQAQDSIISFDRYHKIVVTSDSIVQAIYKTVDSVTVNFVAEPAGANDKFPILGKVPCGVGRTHVLNIESTIEQHNACWKFDSLEASPGGEIFSKYRVTSDKWCEDITVTAHYRMDSVCAIVVSDEGSFIAYQAKLGDTIYLQALHADSCCMKFLHWKDFLGDSVFSVNARDSFVATKNLNLIAIYEKKNNVNLRVSVEPAEASDNYPISTGWLCKGAAMYGAPQVGEEWEFVNWEVHTENYFIIEDNNILRILELCDDAEIIAHFRQVNAPVYTLRAPEQRNILPTTRSHRIPIYIKADRDIAKTNISKLELSLEKSVFQPVSLELSGIMASPAELQDTTNGHRLEITVSDLEVLNLQADKEEVLFYIKGNMALGRVDSTTIQLEKVEFANSAPVVDTINGFITLDICRDGGDRLLDSKATRADIIVSASVGMNLLEINCHCIENGSYSLYLTDLLGYTKMIKDSWHVNTAQAEEYYFDFSLEGYSPGSYYIFMQTPTQLYHNKFTITK